jgi:NAD(P)-dependent dehydrogenase (short-subunit alcohol dehydrogenase family)
MGVEFWCLDDAPGADRPDLWEELLSETHLPWSVRVSRDRQKPNYRTWVRGKIINIASIGGPAYCSSKGAVVNLTRQLAVDFAPERINVNAICPGFLATAMVRPFLDDPELNKTLHDLSPWPHLGTAEDVGKLVLYLASYDAEMVTGSMQVLDGGYTAG